MKNYKRLDFMKRKMLILFLCSVMLMVGVCGCSNKTEEQSSSSSQVIHVDGTFDIEEVRKNINIKGYQFEIPIKLKDLEKGLTYEMNDYHSDSVRGVDIFKDGELFFEAAVDGAEKKTKHASIYNIIIEESDTSIDGIIPTVTTKEEVLKRYGEPRKIELFDNRGVEEEKYRYGEYELLENLKTGDYPKAKTFTVVFGTDGIVKRVIICYKTKDN